MKGDPRRCERFALKKRLEDLPNDSKTPSVRLFSLLIPILCLGVTASAGEIREFSIPTLERLGNELTRASQSPDWGASDATRKRARETAAAALRGKLFDTRYDYVVLSDPDGKRLLVYALAVAKYTDQVVMAGHFRVTVSADGTKAERVDALSKVQPDVKPACWEQS